MSISDAVKNANASGQIDKIVADIIDPTSQNTKDVVENIWRFALAQMPWMSLGGPWPMQSVQRGIR